LVDAGHPVDVVAEVHVGVEDRRALRQLFAELLVPELDQLLGPLERVLHPRNLPGTPHSKTGATSRCTKTGSATAPSYCGIPSTTTFGTAQTSIASASAGNSDASIAPAETRGAASAQRYASSTAGGHCAPAGVTKAS